MIDLDANATTALLPDVLEAMMPWLKSGHSNPSGAHAGARFARKAIDHAREQVASLIGAEPEEVIFTSGGTESVNTALHSLSRLAPGGRVVSSAIEHSAVLRCAESLGRDLRLIRVNHLGCLEMDDWQSALDGAAFVSLMAANNETGVLQPLQEAASVARKRGLAVHSDAIQAVGKIHVDVAELGVDLLSISAHKFHGPKGVGALFLRKGLAFQPLLYGGGQESGRRSGTENTAAIVGMGAAAALAKEFLASGGPQCIGELRDLFENRLCSLIEGVARNGDPDRRLPNTSHLSFEGCDAAGLLILLDEAGIACSAGSACMTGKQKPSHVQMAMGIPLTRARSSLRFSFSRLNTRDDAEAAAQAVSKAVTKLRRVQGSGVGPVVVYSP